MKTSHLQTELKLEIERLQAKQDKELAGCKAQVFEIIHSLEPMNLIKNGFKEIINTPDIKKRIISYLFGVSATYISNKVLSPSGTSAAKQVIGMALKYAVKNLTMRRSSPESESEF